MVKNFIHILRTYLITFRYLKKNEISNLQLTSLFFVFYFITYTIVVFLISLI